MCALVLKRLLNQGIVVQTLYSKDYEVSKLYSTHIPAKFFCLIVEGCMAVKVGKDGLIFESRSFSHFGAQALMNALEETPPEYRPDFSAWPSTDCLVVIITQQQYRAAHKASKFERERSNSQSHPAGDIIHSSESKDVFSTEWAKAETSDLLEVSKSQGVGGLASIGRYLSKHSDTGGKGKLKQEDRHQNGSQDHRKLLSSSSSSSSAMELQEMGQNLQEQVFEFERTPNLHGSSRFRTSPESGSAQGASTDV